MQYYVKTDDNGFVTNLSVGNADGYVKIVVPDPWIDNFVKYFDKFRVGDDGLLQAPNNLPEVSVAGLADSVNQLTEENSNLKDSLTSLDDSHAASSATLAMILQGQIQQSASLSQVSNTLGMLMAQLVTSQKGNN